MFCAKCGNMLGANDRFCGKCGAVNASQSPGPVNPIIYANSAPSIPRSSSGGTFAKIAGIVCFSIIFFIWIGQYASDYGDRMNIFDMYNQGAAFYNIVGLGGVICALIGVVCSITGKHKNTIFPAIFFIAIPLIFSVVCASMRDNYTDSVSSLVTYSTCKVFSEQWGIIFPAIVALVMTAFAKKSPNR